MIQWNLDSVAGRVTRLPAEKPGNGGSTPNTARDFSLSRSVILSLGPTGVQWVMASLFLNVVGAESKADFTPTHYHFHIAFMACTGTSPFMAEWPTFLHSEYRN